MADLDQILLRALNSLTEPVFIVTPEYTCLFCNKAFLDFVGVGDQCEFGSLPLDSFWPDVRKVDFTAPELVAEFCVSGNSFETVKAAAADLDAGYYLVRLSLLEDQAGEGHFHSLRLRTLGMLAGGIAHDFNNVLAGILGHITYLKTILPGAGPHTESLSAIEEGSKKASQMTQQILNFSKLDTTEELVQIDVCELVAKTWGLLRGAISPEFSVEFEVPEVPIWVNAVEGRLAQVIINLVMNSRDALKSGGCINIKVDITDLDEQMACKFAQGCPSESVAVLTVVDDGMGMPEEVLQRVFEPYYSTKKDKGTGLGLSTVQSIVKEIGAAINIESVVGSGTTVAVFIPVAEEDSNVQASDKGEILRLESGTERILVVDDEDPVRNVLCVSLAHLGYQVEIASSGAEALEKLEAATEPIDLVILDMLMPNLSGDEVFFRMMEIDSSLRVLVISGYSSEEAVQRILDRGGKGFIQKPFTIEELSKQVRMCLDD